MVILNDVDHSRKLGVNIDLQPRASTSTSGCTLPQVRYHSQNMLSCQCQVRIRPGRPTAEKEPDHPLRLGNCILRNTTNSSLRGDGIEGPAQSLRACGILSEKSEEKSRAVR